MKILLVTSIFPPDIGGPATYVDQLAQKLLQKHQVAVVTFSNKKIPDRPFVVYKVSTQGCFLSRQWYLFKTIYCQAKEVNIIYAQGAIVVGLTSILVGRFLRKKVIIKFVGDEVWETAEKDKLLPVPLKIFYQRGLSWRYKILNWLQKLSLQLATQVITPAKELKIFLVNIQGVSFKKISVIPNAGERKTLKVTKINNQLIFVGRLMPWKHVGDIIKAVGLARKKRAWQLVIVGEGPEKKRLAQLAKQLQAETWVCFTGALSHKQALRKISQSKILILYSSYEGLPHVIIEAMLAKTAIIASDIPSNREVLENGKLGRLIRLSEPKMLAEALVKKYPEKMIKRSYEVVRQKYSWDNHLRLVVKILKLWKSK